MSIGTTKDIQPAIEGGAGSRRPYGILAVATGINFTAGLLYIWSVMAKGLVQQMGWSSKAASLPYTAATVSFVIAMVVFGRLQDRKGPRLTAALSGALIGLGMILSGFAKSPAMMVVTFGVLVGAGIGISNVSTTPPAVKWFAPSRKGMVTGVVVAGIGLASVFYSPTANALIHAAGISKTFMILGAGAFVVILALSTMLVNPPAGYVPEGAAGGARPTAGSAAAKAGNGVAVSSHAVDIDSKTMLRRPDFAMLWLMLAFASAAGLMVIGHAASIAKVQAHWEGGFVLVILMAVFNASGRLLGGTVSDRVGKSTLLRIVFGLQAVNMLAMPFAGSSPALACCVALAGLCYGATFSIFPAIVMEKYGMRDFGANYGFIMTAWGLGGVIGPMTAAAFLDSTGDYLGAYVTAFVLLVVAVGLTFVPAGAGKK